MVNKEFEKIGLVDEEELKALAGAGEVQPRSTIPCGAAIFGGITAIGNGIKYTLQDSANSCPTGRCTSQC